MTVYTVSSAAALSTILKTVHGGDTVQLSAGNYSGVVISSLNFATPITITSASAANEATIDGLKVASSSGINFSNLVLSSTTSSGPVDPYYAFRVSSSQNISFNKVDALGSSSVAPSANISGFYISASSNVSITNSNLQYFTAAITANNNTGLNFSGNTFANLDKGGIEMGGSSQVQIANNSFTNFTVAAGTHADAIQLYTAGTTTPGSNISITGNTITRGSGDATQGIFITDDVGTLPYHNLTISNNTVIGGMWNSIYVSSNTTGALNVENNLVESWAGLDKAGAGNAAAMIATTFATTSFLGDIDLLGNLSGATVTEQGNVAQGYLAGTGTSVPAPAGNTQLGVVNPITSTSNLNGAIHLSAATAAASSLSSVTGNALLGDSGTALYLADVGVGTGAQKVVSTTGTTFAGSYGNLTIQANGAYTYTETKAGLTVGQTYVDHFTTTVASASGGGSTSSIDITVTGSGVGNGQTDSIVGGAGHEVISNFGGNSRISSGSGQDNFVFSTLASSTPTQQTIITGFKAGDIVDLSAIDPQFHLVSKLDGHANELVVSQIGTGNWLIYGDTTGSGTANFEIHLTGATTSLSASSFHL